MKQSHQMIRRMIRKTRDNAVNERILHRSNCMNWSRHLAVIDILIWAHERKLRCGRILQKLALEWVAFFIWQSFCIIFWIFKTKMKFIQIGFGVNSYPTIYCYAVSITEIKKNLQRVEFHRLFFLYKS